MKYNDAELMDVSQSVVDALYTSSALTPKEYDEFKIKMIRKAIVRMFENKSYADIIAEDKVGLLEYRQRAEKWLFERTGAK